MIATECGAACLAMVLGYHGKHVPLGAVREQTGVGRDGVRASDILDAAKRFEMTGHGIRIEPEDLADLEPGAILHWELNHFVVLERMGRSGAEIVDPAVGRRRVPRAELDRALTGVALVLEPAKGFTPQPRARQQIWRHVGRVLAASGLIGRVLAASAILQILTLALPAVVVLAIGRVIPRADRQFLLIVAAAAALALLVQALTTAVRAFLLAELRTLLDARMTFEFVEHLVALPIAFFQQRTAGDLLLRLGSNGIVRETLSLAAVSAALDGALVTSYLAIATAADARIGLLLLALGAAHGVAYLLGGARQRALVAESLGREILAQSHQIDIIAGMETLKMAGCEREAEEAGEAAREARARRRA